MCDDWIHAVEVGKKFAEYDFNPPDKDSHELMGQRIAFSYHHRPNDTITDHTGTIVDLDIVNDALYHIHVDIDGADRILRLDDIGVVRSVADNDAHLGAITALDIG